ncbi:hypothetical protein EZZ81_22690 [Pseudomonas viridiflava]|uniref:Uncharacterized protein n=1 Tax=Pseudomonas viridiflava TaxID=33069 RepID=A0AA46ZXJ9_PSEVI|nr:hypothetical protein EZZ81_22690 [Pseudomonas viridiflava]
MPAMQSTRYLRINRVIVHRRQAAYYQTLCNLMNACTSASARRAWELSEVTTAAMGCAAAPDCI